MTLPILLIRHGRQNAGFDADLDPGLDGTGVAQASAMAEALGADNGADLISSPLRRARLTAGAVEARWGRAASVEPRVAEVPTTGLDLAGRGAWLKTFLYSTWSAQPAELQAWRQGVIDYLLGRERPAVIVSHFVVINVAIGFATGDDRITPTMPDHCSINRFAVGRGHLILVEQGAVRETIIG